MAWTDPDAAREAQRKSVEVRRARKALKDEDPEAYLRSIFSAQKAELSQELLDAALGNGSWHDLPLDKRLTALTKALEYAVGKPTTTRSAPESTEPAPAAGLSIT